MGKVFLRLLQPVISGFALREMVLRVVLVLVLLCTVRLSAVAAVTVLPGTGGTGICSNKAASGVAPAFTSLGAILITEGLNSDFSIGTNTVVLQPPAGWQFSGVLPAITYITGSNVMAVSGFITSTALTVNITATGSTMADQVMITGLQVQPITTTASAGNIVASMASGIAGISLGMGGTNFASLSVTAPVTPSVTLASVPLGAFCPGTAVVFTPTPVHGGSPTYTWTLNGVDVSIGSSYTNSTLSNGNTISCRMNSSVGCVTTNPVFSNTITATVLVAPAAITGLNTVCPGNTIAQACATTGGTWSSTIPSVATINSSGVVTGVSAGTTVVSYTAGGCASKKTIFVNNPPLAPVLTPTVTTICDATGTVINAAPGVAPTTILSQNFNAGVAPWVVDTVGSIGILPGSEWKACADSYLNEQGWYRSPDSSTFVMANADTSGSSATLSTRLTSPTFSLALYSAATLTFQHAYDYWPAGDVHVNLEISTNGGATWTVINNFIGATIGGKMSFVNQSFSLNAYLGNSNVKIRFNYRSTFGYYWAIDNILITGVTGVVTPTWSPVTHLYTDAAHTIPYTAGTATNTVYVYPTGVTAPTVFTYTATATAGACSNAATTAVTVNPPPGSTTGALNLCTGISTTLTNTAAGGTWVSGNAAVAVVGSATGVVTGVSIGTAAISYIVGAGCAAISVVTVSNTPPAITGDAHVCLGTTDTLQNAVAGGTWSSSNTTVASVDTFSGVVSGLVLGTANITYSIGVGCAAVRQVTVQPLPAAITGPSVVCATQSTTLANATTGGTWQSSSTAIATIGSVSGILTGISDGTATITYRLTTTGCIATKNISVNPLAMIVGDTATCIGLSTTLTNAATGGTWSSSNTAVITVGATTGILNSIGLGTSVISYLLPTGCAAARVVTVHPLPTGITGASSVCVGSTTTLFNATTGGSWASSNTAVATVVAATGAVSGVSAGTVMITYTAATGCYNTYAMTVQPVPAAITGVATVCTGQTSILSNATMGGTWSSSNAAVATVSGITASTALLTGITAGTATATYTLPTGCRSVRSVTVHPLPSAIVGTLTVCQGLTTTLTNATTGGTWASSNTTVAIAGSSTGVVQGFSAGTTTISYVLPTGCSVSAIVTVHPLPAAIDGSSTVCTGNTTVLSNTVTGGTWSSSNTAAASVVSSGASAGSVVGISAGVTIITYTLPTGCIATLPMTVNTSPAAITGATSVCEYQTTLLSNTTPAGAWSSSNTTVATVLTSGGLVSGISAGTTIITYMLSTGCVATTMVTVLPIPAAITGTLNICPGTSSVLVSAPTGGTWTSSTAAFATIGSASGVLAGVAPGLATVTYTLPTGCYNTASVVVNPLPSAIAGSLAVCAGSSTLYTSATPSGNWTSSNIAAATVSLGSGLVTGVSAGTAVISYTLPTACFVTRAITVHPLPAPVVGPADICQYASHTFSNATAGGTWSSSMPAVGSVVATTGLVTGVAGGTTVISYTLATGCHTTAALSVTALPATISGLGTVCVGNSILMSNFTPGGSWVSGSPLVASISTVGVVTGLAAGTATISYVLPLGCVSSRVITVNPLPAAITGTAGICISSPTPLASASPGGVWTSSATVVAGISSTTGVVIGYVPGTTVITYTLPTGCIATRVVTVNNTPSAISGASAVCVGATSTFANAVSGGTWSSSNTAIASVAPATGVVSGVAAGVTTITYTLSTGCIAVKSVTVHPLPAAITGVSAICQGFSTTLSSATAGGTWVSSNTSIAGIGFSSGLISGSNPGVVTIAYTLPTGCSVTRSFTVHALPAAIAGSASVCLGTTGALTNATAGGTWASSNLSVATIDTGGVVSGISLGTSVITYTLGVGCFSVRTITVNPLPPSISGSVPTCVGVTILLTNAATGGGWSTSVTTIATVNPTSGVLSPLSVGTTVVSYTLGTGCSATTIVTVTAVDTVVGSHSICVGSVSFYTHSTPGGTWSSGSPLVAGINTTSGAAIGYAVNTATLTYTLPGGCKATKVVTVAPLPAAIGGTASVCPGFTTTLSNSVVGGIWTSGNPAIATIGSSSGIVTGVAPGLVSIQYALTGGCSVSRLVTVNPLPAAITGGGVSICVGSTLSLSSATAGGVWSSSSTAIASVGAATGMVTGIGAGVVTISYTPSTGCVATTTLTVHPVPGAILGNPSVCIGSSPVFSNVVSGGVWSGTDATVATIHPSTGVVSTVATGTTTISYTLGVGCAVAKVITVQVVPTAIAGAPSVCVGYTTMLSSTPTGGTWSSSSPVIASVLTTVGAVTGVAAGTAGITYTLPSGCAVPVVVTVSPLPSVIAGVATVCTGATTLLSDPALGGGTWISANPSVATIDVVSGLVTGVSAGTATITYMIGSGCNATRVVSVSPSPAAITGTPELCISMATVLANTTSGGTWVSSQPTTASVGATGIVSGVAAGTAVITYYMPNSCFAVMPVTVNPIPAAISGGTGVCEGLTTSLANATPGGVWGSSVPTVATVSATGVVSGLSSGTTVISYTLGAGCSAVAVVTVHPVPASISGPSSVCNGLSATLTSATSGGVWNSSNTSVATIAGGSGIIAGVTSGTSLISYTIAYGCRVTKTFTVNPFAPSTGNASTCVGFNTLLSNSVSGGVWSSSNTTVASVIASTGMVSGLAAGTSAISYTLPSGCVASTIVTVLPLSAIGGLSSVCMGSTTALTYPVAGGVWSSSNATVASVAGGFVSGIAAGTSVISYSFGNGCVATTVVTVHPVAPIAGPATVCVGQSVLLTNTVSGGTWTTSSATITVAMSTGLVTGVAAGTAHVTYTLPTGCSAVRMLTINPLSATVAPLSLCVADTVTVSNAVAGGTWSSSNTAIAMVNSSGNVTGLAPGTVAISYTLSTGCVATSLLTIQPLPASISGSFSLCEDAVTTLTSTTPGGIWLSSSTAIATVGVTSGLVTSILSGTTVISYQLPTGCLRSVLLTVNPLPSPISGTLQVCEGAITTLSNATSGGVWSSGNPSVATIHPATGMVSGIAAGVAPVVYTLGSGCAAVAIITVNPIPAAITGADNVCVGASVSLSTTTTGGIWGSSGSFATIGATSGIVSGTSAGSGFMSYTLPTGCYRLLPFTVHPLPAPITGLSQLCVGGSTVLASATSGGVWFSSATHVVGIGATSGIVSAFASGVALISYTLSTGCFATYSITVNPLPAAITGTLSVCEGSTTLLSSASTSGSWSVSATSIATISSAGLVTGISSGVTYVTYTLPTGCKRTAIVTVNPLPASVTGAAALCVAQSVVLSSASPGGVWSSSVLPVATIGATSGILTGVSTGVTDVNYTLPTGCARVYSVTVNTTPAAIAGTPSVCLGATTSLSNTYPGGVWSSGNAAIATVGTSGNVSGVAVGVVPVSYSLTTGCRAIVLVSVNPNPPSITGVASICPGTSVTLSNTVAGGSWSGTPSLVSVDALTGVVTGVATGLSVITYTLPTGCFTNAVIFVNTPPAAVTGTSAICIGATTALTNTTTGGTWLSSTPAVATVGSVSGVVTGIAAGVASISYVLPSGCFSAMVVTVHPLPALISGSGSVCIGAATVLSNSLPGGVWSTASPAVAIIGGGSGIITGMSLGTTLVTYTLPTGCARTTIVTVHPLPAPVSGPASVCRGASAFYVSATSGGWWSSGDVAIATIGSATGAAVSLSAGTVVISYTIPTGCSASAVLTVHPSSPITGSSSVCSADTILLTNAVSGGVWSSSATAVGTVSATGQVRGNAPGITVISYSLPSGCLATHTLTVNQLPVSYLLTGGGTFCIGTSPSPIMLAGSATGFGYQLFNGVTPVSSLSGTGAALHFGLHTLAGSYTVRATNLTTGCVRTMPGIAVVNPVSEGPATIAISAVPGDTLCAGSSVLYTTATYLAGSAPAYQWQVNGVVVSTAAAFTYAPLAGDVITCRLTSSASCAVPAVAFDTLLPVVLPAVIPFVTTVVLPNDTLCEFTSATYSAFATGGGLFPAFRWLVNGSLAGTGSAFSYLPAHADVVYCIMVSDDRCRLTDTAYSTPLTMTVSPYVVPTVSISAAPSFTINAGDEVMFSATVANAGDAPSYQWYINSVPVVGATTSTFVHSGFAHLDTVTCRVVSSGICSGIVGSSSEVITVNNVGVTNINDISGHLMLLPNPNTGNFIIKGSLPLTGIDKVELQVYDILGKLVLRTIVADNTGNIHVPVQLPPNLANGMYTLNVTYGNSSIVFHFVVRK